MYIYIYVCVCVCLALKRHVSLPACLLATGCSCSEPLQGATAGSSCTEQLQGATAGKNKYRYKYPIADADSATVPTVSSMLASCLSKSTFRGDKSSF